MVLESKQTCIGYRCSHCGGGVKSIVGVFSLSGNMMKLMCPCGASELTITRTNDGKLRITVPCMLCGKDHSFTISEGLFYNKDSFVYSCPYTGMPLVFIGNHDTVAAGLESSEKELKKILEEMGVDDLGKFFGELDKLDEEEKPLDPSLFDAVMYVIKDLMEEGRISCCCDDGEYDVAVSDDHVKVYCKSCGASKDIPTDSELAVRAFIETDHLKLEKL